MIGLAAARASFAETAALHRDQAGVNVGAKQAERNAAALDRELPEREPGSVSYSAAVESAATRDDAADLSPFVRRVERETRRRGFDRPVAGSFGHSAPWIWNIADELFPDAMWHSRPRASPYPHRRWPAEDSHSASPSASLSLSEGC